MARAYGRIRRGFRQRFLARRQRLRQILCRAVRVHDHHPRAPVLFLAQVPQFFVRENRSLIILRVAIQLAQLLVQDRKRPPP